MTEFGITRFGAYIPRLRIARSIIAEAHAWMAPGLRKQAKGSRAFASWDEDAVTMAVEAARDCLGNTPRDGIERVAIASTTLPYADLQHASLLASALQLGGNVAALDISSSQRAGTSGLLQALTTGATTLFAASDAPLGKPASAQELGYGAAAAALLLGSENVVARLLGSSSVTAPFIDHFRASGERYDYFWEERWIRDEGYGKIAPTAAKAALDHAGLTIADIDHFVMPSMQRGAADLVARSIGFAKPVAASLDDGVGYAGCAHALLMLVAVLENAGPGERILLIGFGQGADALVLETTAALASVRPVRGVAGAIAAGFATDSYLRMLSFQDGIDVEWGMRAEKHIKTAPTEQFRSEDQIDGIVAGTCGACGTVQFPQLAYCVNPACVAPAAGFTPTSLVDEPARVLTFTADWLSYYPSPPMYVGFAQFDNGARMLTEMVDVDSGKIDVGTSLRLTYRIKDRDKVRGYNRYFWKATPAGTGE